MSKERMRNALLVRVCIIFNFFVNAFLSASRSQRSERNGQTNGNAHTFARNSLFDLRFLSFIYLRYYFKSIFDVLPMALESLVSRGNLERQPNCCRRRQIDRKSVSSKKQVPATSILFVLINENARIDRKFVVVA
jgi:hypothetical protein